VQSNASACKKIEVGDELVYVDGHTVVSAVLYGNFNGCATGESLAVDNASSEQLTTQNGRH